jgi:hypothetical protein
MHQQECEEQHIFEIFLLINKLTNRTISVITDLYLTYEINKNHTIINNFK